MYEAFQGANGWYVAFERDDGFHQQPVVQNLTETAARREAAERNAIGDSWLPETEGEYLERLAQDQDALERELEERGLYR